MWAKFSNMAWTKDEKGFFYQRYDAPASIEKKAKEDPSAAGTETDRDSCQKVYYHRVGTKQDEDTLIFQDPSQPNWVYFSTVTNDGKYLIVDKRGDCDDDLGTVTFADISTHPNTKLDSQIQFTTITSKYPGGL